MSMTDTIDATIEALDHAALGHAAPIGLSSSPPPPPPPLLPPPAFGSPAPLPPPIAAAGPAPAAALVAAPAPGAPIAAAPTPVATAAPAPAAPAPAAPAPVATAAPAAPPVSLAAAPALAPAASVEPVTEDEPAAEPTPMISGPSAIFSADAALMPADLAVPLLPTTAPATPSPTTATSASAFDLEDFLDTQGPARKTKTKPKRRWFIRLLLVGLLGAGGWYGKQHGPELYDQYVNKTEEGLPAEATAPLAFPNVTAVATPIRTAEFVLVGLPGTPSATYRVTTDFETDVSQVDITRDDAPDLQILTYGSDAMIRRADGDQWYLLDRGQFPLDGRLERSDWVRRIEELLPNDVRSRAAINQATESTIAGVPTRHLLLTVDPALLGPVSVDAAAPPADAAVDPAASPALPTDEPVDIGAAIPAAAAVAPGASPVAGSIQLEVWIDGEGLVRQVSGAPQLGAETITIVNTSAEAWIPDYPTPDEIAPLTASALVDLGI